MRYELDGVLSEADATFRQRFAPLLLAPPAPIKVLGHGISAFLVTRDCGTYWRSSSSRSMLSAGFSCTYGMPWRRLGRAA